MHIEIEELPNKTLGELFESGKSMFKAFIGETVKEVLSAVETEREQDDTPLSSEELCERWHISRSTLANFMREGKIQPSRVGRRVLFDMEKVLEAEANGKSRRRH